VRHSVHLYNNADLGFQTLVTVLISILLTGMGGLSLGPEPSLNTHSSHRSDYSSAPEVAPVFCSAVVKLVAMQMQALGVGSLQR
jgi:hypothetical protein